MTWLPGSEPIRAADNWPPRPLPIYADLEYRMTDQLDRKEGIGPDVRDERVPEPDPQPDPDGGDEGDRKDDD